MTKLKISYACRTRWRASHRHVDRLCQCDVASIGQRGYDQALSASQKFVLVEKVHVGDRHLQCVFIVVKVEAGLLEPFEVSRRFHMHLYQIVKNVSLMNLFFVVDKN